MNVAIDIRCLMEKELTGVGEYTFHLLKHLFEVDNKNQYYLFYNSRQDVSQFVPKFPKDNVHYCAFRWPNKLLNLSIILFNRPKLDLWLQQKYGAPAIDLFFFPNLSFFATDCPYIVTVHDISFKFFPQFLDWKRLFWHWFVNPPKKIQGAKTIISVSNNTAKDLIANFKIEKRKIKTIYSGITTNYKIISGTDQQILKIRKKYDLPKKFILFLGTLEPRKNIETLIAAFNIFQRQHPEYFLVIAGKRGWKCAGVEKNISRTRNALCVHFIKDAEKRYFYNAAQMFVYPSYYEGFGFPPLEAMACGCPVITSNNSSLSEICADAALLIDPLNANDIALAMEKMLEPETLAQYKKAGLQRAKNFNWYSTAQAILQIFSC